MPLNKVQNEQVALDTLRHTHVLCCLSLISSLEKTVLVATAFFVLIKKKQMKEKSIMKQIILKTCLVKCR